MVFALTDPELATFLLMSLLRAQFPGKHATQGVFLTAEDRRNVFGLTRTAWRGTDLLHRFRIIDRLPAHVRNYRTGKVGDFERKWAKGEVKPVLFTLNDEALQRPALATIHQVLTTPTEEGVPVVNSAKTALRTIFDRRTSGVRSRTSLCGG